MVKTWPRLLHPQSIPCLETGLFLILLAALVNLILGLGLMRIGKRTQSLTLVADGQHLLTDVLTSLGVLGGLGLVWFTGWYWLDSAAAILVAVSILVTGAKLMRQSFQGLMDTSEPGLLEEIARVMAQHRKDTWIDIHRLRARRAGRRVLLDFHLILPREFTLAEVHREVKELEGILNAHFGGQADILIHTDPCEEPVCPICGHDPCQQRQEEPLMQRLWRSKTLTCEAEEKKDILPQPDQD